jgi:hypothetical protein
MNERARTQLAKLLKYHAQGVFGVEEAANQIAALANVGNIGELLDAVPNVLLSAVKTELSLEARRFADEECLEPEGSPFEEGSSSVYGQYCQRLLSTLFSKGKLHHKCRACVFCLPSFEPEWALQLLDSRLDGYSLVMSLPASQIWEPAPGETISVSTLETGIGDDMAIGVLAAWMKMLQRVRYPISPSQGLDGITYHFLGRGMGGRTWSPDPQTAPGRLVELSHALRAYVEASEENRCQKGEQIFALIEWFRQLA